MIFKDDVSIYFGLDGIVVFNVRGEKMILDKLETLQLINVLNSALKVQK